MFKKSLETTKTNPVKGSDSRKLRRQLYEQYPLLSDEQLDSVWPNSAVLEARKVANRLVVYVSRGKPLFYTNDGEASLHPTLYLVHVAPQIIPCVTVHPGVGTKLARGPDLFMPGLVMHKVVAGQSWVIENFGRFKKDEVRLIVEEGRWWSSAIARWTIASDELEHQGMTGRGLVVDHVVGDSLWASGPGRIPTSVDPPASAAAAIDACTAAAKAAELAGAEAARVAEAEAAEAANATFLEDGPKMIKRKQKVLRSVVELREKASNGELIPSAEQKQKIDREPELVADIAALQQKLDALLRPDEVTIEIKDVVDAGESLVMCKDTTNAFFGVRNQGDGEDGDGTEPSHAPTIETKVEVNEDPESKSHSSSEEPVLMDDLLTQSFLLALQTTVSQKNLPMLAATLYAQHVLPASRLLRGPQLNVKYTQWKKLGVFLESMARAGLIVMEIEKAGVDRIVSFDHGHSLLLSYDPSDDYIPVDSDEKHNSDFDAKLNASGTVSWDGTLPKRGAKKIEVLLKKVRGNKNITQVSRLGNFGIKLDSGLQKEMKLRFSAAVSYVTGPDATAGTLITIQGKYVRQVANFITERFKIPAKYLDVKMKGVSKHDKMVNV